ncbi:MAG: putative metal-dependent HD superfamily phosphohydrolase [Polaribacter sp.]|jgi:predicted metal-dependent HD superfamily phosphohydrolase
MLLDFDLEILSRDWKDYELYTQQIRKEYWMYPGPIYRKGRREAMQHFLEREYIYQSELFRTEGEEKARANIVAEIKSLS